VRAFGIFLAAVIVVIAAGWWYVTRIPSSPFDGVARAPTFTLEESEYVARAADCVACHSTEDGLPFAGGLEMGTPMGSIFATNITPDPEHGIGGYTLAQFDNAVRRGVLPDGTRIYPAMPYPSYAKLTDEDVAKLYDYFMNHVQPVAEPVPQSDIPWPLNIRWPLEAWNVAFYRSGTYQPDPARDELWNRGAYLVQGAGHCGSCHTPRGFAIQERGYDEGDAAFLTGGLLDGWYAPPLRNGEISGLGRWSEDEIAAYLRNGRNRHSVVFGTMMEAFNNSTAFMTDDDLQGIARYLASLPGTSIDWNYDETTTERLLAGDLDDDPGAQIYLARCSYCHGRDGLGRGEFLPPLAGASAAVAPHADSAINLTLNGAGRVVSGGVPDSYRMPPFRVPLSDREIADVLTFVRSAWGNDASAVTPEQVADLRERTDPMSDRVIVLQMR